MLVRMLTWFKQLGANMGRKPVVVETEQGNNLPADHAQSIICLTDVIVQFPSTVGDGFFEHACLFAELFDNEAMIKRIGLLEKKSALSWKAQENLEIHPHVQIFRMVIILEKPEQDCTYSTQLGTVKFIRAQLLAQARSQEIESSPVTVNLGRDPLFQLTYRYFVISRHLQPLSADRAPAVKAISAHQEVHKINVHDNDTTDLSNAVSPSARLLYNFNDSDFLHHLGRLFEERYERLGDLKYLDMAICAHEDCTRLTPKSDLDRWSVYQKRLGEVYRERFEKTRNRADIDKAVDIHETVVHLCSSSDTEKSIRFYSLGRTYMLRFELLGDGGDIDKAILHLKESMRLAMQEGNIVPLASLGTAHNLRFNRTGNLADNDEAIRIHEEVLRLCPKHSGRGCAYAQLGTAYSGRFEYFGDPADLRRIISLQQESVRCTPPGPHQAYHLALLGMALRGHFKCSQDPTELDNSVSCLERAVVLLPKNHPTYLSSLANLGASYTTRFEHSGDIADITKGISLHDISARETPESDPAKPCRLNNLAIAYFSSFERSRTPTDLDKAIDVWKTALDLTPSHHAHFASHGSKLGNAYESRHLYHNRHDDFDMAIRTFRLAATSSTSPPNARLHAALQWARLAKKSDASLCLEGYTVAIDLLPRVAWMGQTITSRHTQIIRHTGLGSEAAAAAIMAGRTDLALEWLEQARSIVWGQMLQLRTPVDRLRAAAPQLADDLEQISRALQHAGLETNDEDSPDRETIHIAEHNRHQLANDWDRLVKEARDVPGFADFLQPKKLKHLLPAARSGPVAVLNVHESRCDALILVAEQDQVVHLPLENISYEQVQQLQCSMKQTLSLPGVQHARDARATFVNADASGTYVGFEDILCRLWSDVVKPVLDCLGYMPSPNPPRLWWCATGPLGFLPIHAAGNYNADQPGPDIFDFVVSSYTPSLGALLETQQKTVAGFSGLLAISQKSTPKLRSLPNTEEELTKIRAHAPHSSAECLEGSAAVVDSVIRGMERNSWVHFACHALQDSCVPTKSSFYLQDGQLELTNIIDKSFPRADLAFLSACETAMGNEVLSEEAIHLAAGMLLAGYRGVIATMWQIKDEYAPVIADEVYSQLFRDNEPNSERAAYALHTAVQHLRKRLGDSAFSTWVPFIHVGV